MDAQAVSRGEQLYMVIRVSNRANVRRSQVFLAASGGAGEHQAKPGSGDREPRRAVVM